MAQNINYYVHLLASRPRPSCSMNSFYQEKQRKIQCVNGDVLWMQVSQRFNKWGFASYYNILHRHYGPAVIKKNGDQLYYQYGQLHREYGPAVISKHPLPRSDDRAEVPCISDTWLHESNSMCFEWYLYGNLHREDGPALDWGNVQCWCVHGQRHRKDGPAVVHFNDPQFLELKDPETKSQGPVAVYGEKEWYLNDMLHRENGPAVVKQYEDGSIVTKWYLHGKQHRVDGPAVVQHFDKVFCQAWFFNGKLHRVDGPAIINHTTNVTEWWMYGQKIDSPPKFSSTNELCPVCYEETIVLYFQNCQHFTCADCLLNLRENFTTCCICHASILKQ